MNAKIIKFVFTKNISTQIIFGFIGSIYGAYNVIEYYPKNEYNNLLKIFNNDVDTLKDKEHKNLIKKIKKTQEEIDFVSEKAKKYNEYSFIYRLLSLPTIFFLNIEILRNEILKRNDVETINKINELATKNLILVEKPLFLIDENKIMENICLSSIFYGSVFSFFGTFPFLPITAIGIYGIYKKNK